LSLRNKVANVSCNIKDFDNDEGKMLKKFFKKCKDIEITKEHTEKTSYFLSKKQKKRKKMLKNKFYNKKENENINSDY